MNRLSFNVVAILFCASVSPCVLAQQLPTFGCPEIPREDALPSLCVPPTSELEAISLPPIQISLDVPEELRFELRSTVALACEKSAKTVHGKVVEPVYAFDETVIPAGSDASGRVTRIDPVSVKSRVLAYSGGNFTPFHKYQITFDQLALPDGKTISIKTITSPETRKSSI